MAITSLFPILRTTDLPALHRFYTEAFGATIPYRYEDDGIEVYVALAVGGGTLGIGLEPEAADGGSAAVWLYTDDVDAAYAASIAAGAESVARPENMPWGERVAQVRDPDGNLLYLGRAEDETGTT